MPKDESTDGRRTEDDSVLKGTTLRVYRFIFKAGKPVRAYEIQRALKLSSPSLAQYHIAKLLDAGLIKESETGYTVDRVLFGNLVRVRSMVVPFQITYAILFASALIVMLTFLRPPTLTSLYVFALVVIWIALTASLYESLKALRGL
jgi:hypothetical protein